MDKIPVNVDVFEAIKAAIAIASVVVSIIVTIAGWLVTRIAKGIESLDSHVAELGKKVSDLGGQMILVNERQETHKANHAEVRADVREIRDDVSDLQADLQTVKARLFRVNDRQPGEVLRVRRGPPAAG